MWNKFVEDKIEKWHKNKIKRGSVYSFLWLTANEYENYVETSSLPKDYPKRVLPSCPFCHKQTQAHEYGGTYQVTCTQYNCECRPTGNSYSKLMNAIDQWKKGTTIKLAKKDIK